MALDVKKCMYENDSPKSEDERNILCNVHRQKLVREQGIIKISLISFF